MEQPPRPTRLWRKPRYIPLSYRFIFITSTILILLLVTIILVVSRQQDDIIRDQVERRGLAIAQSLAAASKAHLMTYNYVALLQSANHAAQDPDLVHIIIHDKEGRVGAYSGRPELQGKFLDDAISQEAVASTVPFVQPFVQPASRGRVLDVAVPVFIPGSERKWGVVRVGLSLEPMHAQIRRVQLAIGTIGLLALVPALAGCVWLARRITRPVGSLVAATVRAAAGELNQEITIHTADEVEVLADNFSAMIRTIHAQEQQLRTHLAEITSLQRYLNELLTTMSDGLLSVDLGGRLMTMNPAAQHMLGLTVGSVEQRSAFRDLLAHLPGLCEYLGRAVASPLAVGQEELRVHVGEELKTLIVAASPLPDERGEPHQVIVNLHDVTTLKQLEAGIRQAERLAALGTLAAGMAHEIRNPLSAIKTFVQLLPRKLDKPGFLEKFQRTVPRELERINRLIQDLLELARAPRYQMELIDIGPCLRHAIDFFDEELTHHQVRTVCELEERLPLVWADPNQLMKAFSNLIQNAIQAMPQGGKLTIRSRMLTATGAMPSVSDDDAGSLHRLWLNLVFSDSGPGIAPEDVKNIFNPFFTTKDTGTGLGLTITHKVITEHGGYLEVESTPGEGSAFTIRLPALEPAAASLPAVTSS
jgi:two-component system sensor histidine kinase AtoS